MTVTIPEREIEDERTIEERIAELEALIKEARQRARRRRAAYAAVVLVALAGVVTGAIGVGGGGVDIDGSVAEGSPASATNTSRAREAAIAASPLYISAIQVNPKRPNVVYASTLTNDLDRRSVLKSTDGGQTWNAADTGLTEPAAGGGGRSTGGRARARPAITERALRGHRERRLQDEGRSEDVEAREQRLRPSNGSPPPPCRRLDIRACCRPIAHIDGVCRQLRRRSVEDEQRRRHMEERAAGTVHQSGQSTRVGPRPCTRAR